MPFVKGTGSFVLGNAICHAHSKQTGMPCKNKVIYGSKVCRWHGAGGGRPPKNGRYSAAIGKFADAYNDALNDTGLLDVREQIAAMDALAQNSMKRVNELDTPEFRKNVKRRVKEAIELGRTDPAGMLSALKALQDYATVGCNEDNALRTLAYTLDRLARRIEGAWEIKLAKKQAINARDLVAVMARFLDILRGEVEGRVFARIVGRIDKEVMSSAGARELDGDAIEVDPVDMRDQNKEPPALLNPAAAPE